MKKCSFCGFNNEDWNKICQNCGSPIIDAINKDKNDNDGRTINDLNFNIPAPKKKKSSPGLIITIILIIIAVIGCGVYFIFFAHKGDVDPTANVGQTVKIGTNEFGYISVAKGCKPLVEDVYCAEDGCACKTDEFSMSFFVKAVSFEEQGLDGEFDFQTAAYGYLNGLNPNITIKDYKTKNNTFTGVLGSYEVNQAGAIYINEVYVLNTNDGLMRIITITSQTKGTSSYIPDTFSLK